MVAACCFHDGAVIIADTRATWLAGHVPIFQDSLQKVLPITRRIAIAFSGDVGLTESIIRGIRKRIGVNARLQQLRKLAANLERTAKHDYQVYVSKSRTRTATHFILAGITDQRQVEVWRFAAPDFKLYPVRGGFVVIGSGRVVEPYIAAEHASLDKDLPDLKARANSLICGLEAELRQQSIDSVGGLFQAILIEPSGIRPLRYGVIDVDPDLPGKAMEIEARAGR